MAQKTFGKGQSFQVCTTPQDSDLSAVQFAALTYIDVCCLDETPEFSSESNIISETCISGERIRGVGAPDDSDFTASWYYDSACAGQDSLRSFGLASNGSVYAVRKVYADAVPSVSKATTVYARVIFSGYTNAGIGIDDVQSESVSGSIVQGPVVVKPAPV